MPDILPTINNEPAQGIQALLDTVYLWNQDVANDLIEQINHLLEELGEFSDAGCIKPYSEITAPVRQYMPCYNGDNVYVAAADIETLPEQFNPSQWILIATKAPVLQAGAGIDINGNEISVEQQVLSDAAAGGTAVQPEDLGTAAYAATTDFATAAQGALADTAIQSVKTINGNTITGSGNLVITTFTTYPVGWPTTGTTKAFCDAIAADTSATEGMAYLGEVTLSDMPGGIVNSEIKVEIMSGTTALNKVILLTLTSGNVSPYQWQYTYWNNGSSVSGWVATGAQVNADWTSNSGPSQILHKPAIPDVVDNYNSTSANSALSANMGHDLNERLTSVEGRGRFLSTWNCTTGLAGTNPPTSPYTYKSGDYFIVSQVGATNYRPSGAQYVTGTASSTVETGVVAVNDTYQYDGTNWILFKNTAADPLPSQTGNSGKFLVTNGTTASWAEDRPTTHTKITLEYNDESIERVVKVVPKQNRDCWLKVRAYRGMYHDNVGEVVSAEFLFEADVKLLYADLASFEDLSRATIYNAERMDWIQFSLSKASGFFELYTYYLGDMDVSEESQYVVLEIDYTDGVNTIEEGEYWEGSEEYGVVRATIPNPTDIGAYNSNFDGAFVPTVTQYGMSYQRYPFEGIYVAEDNKILVTEDGAFTQRYASQVPEFPEAGWGLWSDGAIFQYTGETTQDYTQGYFYKSWYSTDDRNITASQTSGSNLSNITVDQELCGEFLGKNGVVYGTTESFVFNGANWIFAYGSRPIVGPDLTAAGITYTGTPAYNNRISITFDDANWYWKQIDVQPAATGQTIQVETMPAATQLNEGKIVQFVGEHPEIPASATISQTAGSGLTDLSVNLATFESKEQPTGDETAVFVVDSITPESLNPTSWEEWEYTLAVNPTTFLARARSAWPDFDSWADLAYLRIEYDDGAWTFYALTANRSEIDAMGDDPVQWGVTVTSGDIQDAGYAVHDMAYTRPAADWQKDSVSVDPAQYGISFSGTPAINDELTVDYTALVRGYDNGYFYQSQALHSDPSATISQTVGSGLTDLAVDLETFVAQEQPAGSLSEVFTNETRPATIVFTTVTGDVSASCSNPTLYTDWAAAESESMGGGWDWTQSKFVAYNGGTYWRIENMEGNTITNFSTQEFADYFGIVITGNAVDDDEIDYSATQAGDVWTKNWSVVNLADYGITYSGTPADGDRLTVVYTASQVTGYDWVQKNVQPAGGSAGIDWKTVVDLPANSGLSWSAFPIYTIPGGLPDGEYEFTWQNKCVGVTSDSALGAVTYNCRFTIENNAVTKQYYGKFSPVMSGDGNWLPSGTFIPRQQTLYNFVHVANNGDIDLYYGGTPWSTDIAAYWDNMEVPGCFRLSAIKNVNTGEEYIAQGRIFPGTDPYYAYVLQGQLYMEAFAPSPTIPEYHTTTYVEYSDSMRYFLIQPQHAIANGINPASTPVQCAELDIAVVDTVNGGRYHANVKNGFDTYTATVLEASGTLANTQIGWDRYGQAYLKYNTPANTSGYAYVSLGAKGARHSAGGWPVSSISGNFTPAVITEVGGTITPTNLGTILQYTGTTNASYTNGYFYKAGGTLVDIPAALTATDINPLGCSVAINIQALTLALIDYTGWDEASINQFYNDYTYWQIVYDFDNNNIVQIYWNAWGTMTDSGVNACFTITGSGMTGEQTVTFNSVYTPAGKTIQGGAWVRVDTQPQGSSLPSQTGNAGKFLTTDGSSASWSDKPLVNTATGTNSVTILGTAASGSGATNVGVSTFADYNGTSLGWYARTDMDGVAIGRSASSKASVGSGQYGIAIGSLAKTTAFHAIQFGCVNGATTNNDANTFKVANANGNYEILSANGTIPTDRFTTTPVADGSYVPTLTISSGVATRSWAAPAGGLPSQTGHSGEFLTTDGTDASWATVDALPSQTGNAGKMLVTNGTTASWGTPTTVTFRTWGANE